MSGLIAGAKTIGMYSPQPDPSTLPAYGQDLQAIIDFLLTKVADLQTLVEGKADTKRLKTLIQFSDEAIRIQAENIALVGNVNFLDVWRDQTGQVTGGIHPSLTRIRGGVIQTGTIISSNWSTTEGSEIDLDNGTITMGGSSAPKLKFDSSTGNLEISGEIKAGSIITNSVTIDGVTIDTVKSNAAAGYAIQQALEVSGTTVLKGVLVPADAGALKTGTITWDATTGALTGGTGVAITEFGIIGAASGSATFTINASTGAATFAGALSAATGTFAGDVVTAGQALFTGSSNPSGFGLASLTVTPPTSPVTGGINVVMPVNAAIGLRVNSNNGTAGSTGISVVNANGTALSAGSLSGTALEVLGVMTMSNTTLVSNLNADMVDGKHASSFMEIGTAVVSNLADSTTWTKIETSNDGLTVASAIYFRKRAW